jgi:hypothetical protein
MEDEIKTLIYLPSDEDKAIINGLCSHIIDILEPLSIPQKAFALHSLIESFEDVSGIKATAIIDDNNFAKEVNHDE